ncbi:DUF1657 domain-containing protein [Radiobacillus sp. PE A8.2]|uniref:DUF1657 domain-containing protein n=1 Tax=Radiobacillus sp. PE A8.2 TaxID=3380349 RepID=UPI0038904591
MTVGSQVKQTLSSVKGMQASFSNLLQRTQEKKAQQVFHETMLSLDEIKKDLQQRVGELEREELQYKGF